MNGFRRIVRALLWGGTAGLASLALDQVLAFLTLGFAIRLRPGFVLVYLAAGALAGALTESFAFLARLRQPSGLRIFALASAMIYATSIFERVEQALSRRSGTLVAVGVAALALAGWALWARFLAKVVARSRPRSAQDGDATAYALILASASAALGLAVNRNLVTHPFEPAALAADAAVLGLGLGLAFGVRIAGAARTALAAAILVAAAALVADHEPRTARPPSADARPPYPHLVLLVIDTLRQDVFRAVVEETAEGRRFRETLGGAAWFDRTVAASPWTAPSVASIMTGLYPPEHGFGVAVTGDQNRPLTRLSDSVTTLAERLRAHGYQTSAIVTNPILHPVSGISRGFQRFEILGGPTTKMPLLTAMARIGVLERDYYQDAVAVRHRLADHLADVAADRPSFLWLHLMDPHPPFHGHHDLSPDPRGRELERDERLYRDEIRFALQEVARMIDLLGSAGLWSHAVFVLVSDHGEMFVTDGHGHLPPSRPRSEGHGHALYDELVKVPLVIRPPGGFSEPRRIGVLASHVDLHGTLGDLLGLDYPRLADERVSLAPWLGPVPPMKAPRRRAYALIGGLKDGPPQEGVRTETHKLIRHVNGDLPDELFDLGSDPAEQRNLAGIDAAAETELGELLTWTWSQLRPVTDTGSVGFDEDTRKRLEALGYL